MGKKYLTTNVYEEAMKRIAYCFNEFENVLVSFSGGKDSGVLLNLCYKYAKEHDQLEKLALYHLDYEAQYDYTTKYVTDTFTKFSDIERRFWLCLPVGAQCACNMNSGTWTPWKKEDRAIWVRKMPKFDYVVNENNCPFNFVHGESDYETQDRFCQWFANTYGKTAVMIGIRTDESLNRFRAIAGNQKVNNYKETSYVVGYGDDLTYKAYPIYDWAVDDIWTANARFGFEYNKLYDIFYQAGLTPDQMRVASPFNDCATASLKFYKIIEPNTWGKLVSRVNGVNFTGIYGGTTAMGWKSITKPKDHTWESYCYFLLNTLDEKTRNHYLSKLNTSLKFWKEKGGALSDDTINEIKSVRFRNLGKVSKSSDKNVIAFDNYPDDLPEVTNFREVPTFKRMCVCIMKNDYFCKYMGFAQTKCELEKRKNALEKYKNL